MEPPRGGLGTLLARLGSQFSDSGDRTAAADPDAWRRSRPFCFAFVCAAFLLVNARSLSWGWLGLDDWRFLVINPHLGHGWDSVGWALTDVEYGRRWMPVLWLVACACGVPTAFKFHLLAFVLGLLLSLLVTEIYGQGLRRAWVLPAALLFMLSPLRNEVFTWGMGFVYESVAILLCIAWLLRRSVLWSGFFVVLALLTYPMSAGGALAYVAAHRKRAAGWIVMTVLVALAALEYRLRATLGVIPWHQRFDYLPMILPHYALNLFFPFATVPLFPSLPYPLLYVGGALVVALAVVRPYAVACWILLFSPILAASVTEGFWFGARYCLIPSIAAYGWLVYEASRLRSRSTLGLLWVMALAFCVLNLRDVGLSRGVGLCARVAEQEAALVGIDFNFLRDTRGQNFQAPAQAAPAPPAKGR
jgi:hypothetical protein